MNDWCPCCGEKDGVVFRHPESQAPVCTACNTAFPGCTLSEYQTKARALEMSLDEFEKIKAERWEDWEDAPEAVPRAAESSPISIRFPKKMIAILKEFARREGVGYQALIEKWLDDRIRKESGHPTLEDRVEALERWRDSK